MEGYNCNSIMHRIIMTINNWSVSVSRCSRYGTSASPLYRGITHEVRKQLAFSATGKGKSSETKIFTLAVSLANMYGRAKTFASSQHHDQASGIHQNVITHFSMQNIVGAVIHRRGKSCWFDVIVHSLLTRSIWSEQKSPFLQALKHAVGKVEKA